jgi:hypothetical protein
MADLSIDHLLGTPTSRLASVCSSVLSVSSLVNLLPFSSQRSLRSQRPQRYLFFLFSIFHFLFSPHPLFNKSRAIIVR